MAVAFHGNGWLFQSLRMVLSVLSLCVSVQVVHVVVNGVLHQSRPVVVLVCAEELQKKTLHSQVTSQKRNG